MLVHSFSPGNMLVSTIIPIPKSTKKSLNDSSNYKGIALGSIIGKVFDMLILNTNREVLKSSVTQFGFKEKHSTSQCTFVLNEVVHYYNKNNSDVYVMMLDASKAFDRIEYINLFTLLLKKGLCPLICRILAFMYTNQCVKLRWGHCESDCVSQ